jgi:peptide-methionine (S)-S-oxide reductase
MSIYLRTLFIVLLYINSNLANAEKAIFAGGCFWCMEATFQKVEGVTEVISGFTGGTIKNPSYKGNHQGHYEAIEITFTPEKISYKTLLDIFWVNIDPFDSHGQFCDKGFSYLSAIFVNDENQRQLAIISRNKVIDKFSGHKLITPILTTSKFWPVEEYHQDYFLKNPLRYRYYRYGCGRDKRLQQIWGDAAKH